MTGTGYRRRSYGQFDMLQRQYTETGYTEADLDRLQKKVIWTTGHATEAGHRDWIYRGRFGQVTEESHMDDWTCYRGGAQGQSIWAGHRDRLQRQVTGAVYRAGQDTESGHRDRLQRQVTGTSYTTCTRCIQNQIEKCE
jgi:hypothetical protein